MLTRMRRFTRTLRGRLLLLLIGATVTGLVAMGFASQLLLRDSLMDKLDGRLHEMARPWLDDRPRPMPGEGPEDHGSGPRLPTEFRALLFDEEGRLWSVAGPTETDPRQPMIRRPGPVGEIITVPDRSGGSDWRVLTESRPNGERVALALSTGDVNQTLQWLTIIELVVGGIVVVLLAAASMVTVRLGLRPLTRIEHTAHAIATGDLERRVADQDPSTETGRLGAALNTMLGRLVAALQQREQSEHRLRRFVADASHELRTPLTSIRGFAELYRRSESPGEQDVRMMMSRIESEAVRMGALVEDLLLLARLDRERTIDLVDLDLVPLATDIAGDARVRDPGREIELVVPERAVRVLGDGPRLRQVLTNLMTNALVHTTPGTPVRVEVAHGSVRDGVFAAGAEVRPGTAMGVVSISDAGPGIPPEHAQRIFDRFYRVDDGRERSEGGTGLGLAITAAIAEAHNGRVELATSPSGSTFRLLIPLS
ncbi:sensor histidine kinase [Saccharopolyspora gregorii]|uniref:histidine kinase n=1 Tax=Saccharopolyspora gregorii TaxID=33914 RepID=A0ABP6RMI2_9PSEU|nr:HAMP domain-containing sensor histidine kinase [Saccharopolyspora gregorii]